MKKKDGFITMLLITMMIIGAAILFYPMVSDYLNTITQMRAIRTYQEKASNLSDDEIEEKINKAIEYNNLLYALDNPFSDYEQLEDYYEILDISGTGVMGIVNIPAIDVELPVYHGTNSEVLNVAIGHLEGSSLPVGGSNTHTVLSAHRGLPSAKLFSDLDDLREGDRFTITVINRTVTYEVDQISIVEPDDTSKLQIENNGDYATLLTCTPYGINTHRLLVRGHRVENREEASKTNITADAVVIDKISVIPFIAIPLFIILIIYWIWSDKKRKEKLKRKERINNGKI